METLTPLITEDEINARVTELAAEISADYAGRGLYLICVLKGAVMFAADIARRIDGLDVRLDFLPASSYGSGTASSGGVKITKDIEGDIRGKSVLIIEDIVDTGLTLAEVVKCLKLKKPESVEVCALLKRRGVKPRVNIKYAGFEIGDGFVVGYGLDYDQKYRNLKCICKLDFVV